MHSNKYKHAQYWFSNLVTEIDFNSSIRIHQFLQFERVSERHQSCHYYEMYALVEQMSATSRQIDIQIKQFVNCANVNAILMDLNDHSNQIQRSFTQSVLFLFNLDNDHTKYQGISFCKIVEFILKMVINVYLMFPRYNKLCSCPKM